MSQGSILSLSLGKIWIRDAVEEPRRVVGGVGRQVRPVLEVVVGEQADIGHEDTGVDVDAVPHVEVVAAVHLADVAQGRIEVELTLHGADIVARNLDRSASRTAS